MAYSILGAKELESMRRAGRLAGELLGQVGHWIEPGVTTESIDAKVAAWTVERGAVSAPLGYRGFPKHCCISINEEVCHGIPGSRVIESGDLVNVDVTPILGGWHGDTNATFYVGMPSAEARHVTEVSRRSLQIGLEQVRPGARLHDIGAAIQEFVHAQGCGIVRAYSGHGIGRIFHCEPTVPHFKPPGRGVKLKRGMCFTIEPMINVGGYDVDHLDDGWTVITRDGSLSAQFEHTVVVTKTGYEVLTVRDGPLVNSEDRPWVRLD
jgi:methionyl aminopeptidase